jgi:hypothetical protein
MLPWNMRRISFARTISWMIHVRMNLGFVRLKKAVL